MQRVGFVGWRGMVGSVLMARLKEDQVFKTIDAVFFSSSQKNQRAPDYGQTEQHLYDAYDIDQLKKMDIIVSTQGTFYTKAIYKTLKETHWSGYWIDAASHLRLDPQSLIALDPINKDQLIKGLESGVKTYVGGNCTVSLMLMALDGLLKEDLIESVIASTYQAISGAGAKAIRELFGQYQHLQPLFQTLSSTNTTSLDLEKTSNDLLTQANCPTEHIGSLLATNVLPWIDEEANKGQTKEEWKAMSETNKLLGRSSTHITIDSTCVRVSTLRSHCQSLTLKLKKELSIETAERLIHQANPWVHLIPNNKKDSLSHLVPLATANSLRIHVGRLRPCHQGAQWIQLFTVGDQLLWGAAEPLKRLLELMVDFHSNRHN